MNRLSLQEARSAVLRLAAKTSLNAVAKEFGVPQATMHRFVHGKNVTARTIEAIGDRLCDQPQQRASGE